YKPSSDTPPLSPLSDAPLQRDNGGNAPQIAIAFNAFDSTIPFSPKAISSLRRTASCWGRSASPLRGSHSLLPRLPQFLLVVLGSASGFRLREASSGFRWWWFWGSGDGAPAVVVEEEGGGGGGGGGENGKDGSDRSVLSWYLMALDKYPVTTKAITSAILTLVGDLICQLLIDQVSKLDLKRTFVFTLLGLVLVGPTLHIWYLYLSKLVTASGASGAFVRLLLDQFIFSPIFIGVFMSLLVTLEGRPSLVVPKLQQEWFSSVLANWQLWIPFQFLNFYFVPQKFQVLAANFVALAWNVILSFKAHKEVVLK
ncbi:protein sym-1, partial [Ananas comosus]|uniref:Protein sym-1 n=1 Tax=Ananas comosus TaxID=4615 RepID=A0A6P5G8F3_ANACO